MTQPTNTYDNYDAPMADYKVHTTKDIWNIRNQPSTSGVDIGDMPLSPTDALLSKAPVAQDGTWDWYKININGIKGFVAQFRGESTPNVFTPIVTDTPDEPTKPDTEAPDGITQEQIDALVKSALEAEISRLLEPFHVDIPIPAFTFTLPSILRESKAQEFEAIGKTYLAMAQRIREGTPTASQIDAIGYASSNDDLQPTLTNSDGTLKINFPKADETVSVSDLITGDDMPIVTNEADTPTVSTVSNGDDDDSEDLVA